MDKVFVECGKEILGEFPNARRWLQWWLQPSVASTIFNCRTLIKDSLRLHASRTSNAIEAYHSVLYKLIAKRRPIATSLRLIIAFCRTDGRLLRGFNDHGIVPRYGKKRKRTAKDVNDGRAPDTNKASFSSEKKKKN